MKKSSTVLFAAIAVFLALSLPAQAQVVLGQDYVEINPSMQTDSPAKIEVIEFFSYACPHCSDLNPHLNKWAAKLPTDVAFRRVPVSAGFGPFYQLMSRLFYSLEVIGEEKRLNEAAFDAIHGKGLKLIDDKSIAEWVTAQGVDAKRFSDAYNSFGVASKVSRANQIAAAAKVSGVPALVVDGRYQVLTKSPAEMLAVTSKLIDKRRAERNPKKK